MTIPPSLWDKAEPRYNIYDIKKSIEAQDKYCEENGYPNFARTFTDKGDCFNCGRNIYMGYAKDGHYLKGYTLEYAMGNLVTGCPHCHKSYCD